MTNLAVINEFAIDLTDEIAVQEAMIDAEYNEILLLESIVDLQEELYKNKAVQKVFAEKGSYDDMAFLFVEAENDVAEDKKGIFQKFVELIKKIATNIGNAVKALFGIKVDDNEMIEVDEDFANPQNRSALSNFANKLGGAKGIAGIAAAALAVGGLTFLFVKSTKKTQMKAKDAKAAAEQADKDKNVISSFVSKFLGDPNASSEMNKQEDKSGHTVSDIVKQALSWINTKVNAILGKFKSLLPGGNKDAAAPAQPQSAGARVNAKEGDITDKQGNKFHFDKDGNLVNAWDSNGNIIKGISKDDPRARAAWQRFIKNANRENIMSDEERNQKAANRMAFGTGPSKKNTTQPQANNTQAATTTAAQPQAKATATTKSGSTKKNTNTTATAATTQNTAQAQTKPSAKSKTKTTTGSNETIRDIPVGNLTVRVDTAKKKVLGARDNNGNQINASQVSKDDAKKALAQIRESEFLDALMNGDIIITETEDGYDVTVSDEAMETFIECMNGVDDDDILIESAEEEISMTESLFGTLAALEAEKDPEFNELKSLIDSL